MGHFMASENLALRPPAAPSLSQAIWQTGDLSVSVLIVLFSIEELRSCSDSSVVYTQTHTHALCVCIFFNCSNINTQSLFLSVSLFQCRMVCKDVSAEIMYDVLHDIEYRRKWDTNVIETFDIGKLTVNADVGYYSCTLHTHVNMYLSLIWFGAMKGSRNAHKVHIDLQCFVHQICCKFLTNLCGLLTGKCPKPLRNRDVITLRSWLPIGKDYIIMNYSVKHGVSIHTHTHTHKVKLDLRSAGALLIHPFNSVDVCSKVHCETNGPFLECVHIKGADMNIDPDKQA